MYTKRSAHAEIDSILRALSEGRLVAGAHPEGTKPVRIDQLTKESIEADTSRTGALGTLEYVSVTWHRDAFEVMNPKGETRIVHILVPEGHTPTTGEVEDMLRSEQRHQAELEAEANAKG